MVLHKNIKLKDSPIYGGAHQGLYAIAPISKGEVLWQQEPHEKQLWFDLETINSWEKAKRERFMSRAYIVQEGIYSGIPDSSHDDAECMNHSCEPNCIWYGNDEEMIAGRDIAEGEEITYDYATSEVEGSFHLPMKCLCSTPSCRGMIEPTDYLKPWYMEKYGINGCTSVICNRLSKLQSK